MDVSRKILDENCIKVNVIYKLVMKSFSGNRIKLWIFFYKLWNYYHE